MRKLVVMSLLFTACAHYDTVIRNGTIHDGRGGAPRVGAPAIRGNRIVAVDDVRGHGTREIDASGFTVAPGVIVLRERKR